MTHVCLSKLTIIGSDTGLSLDRRQAIIWPNAGILFNGPLGTNFSDIFIQIYIFSFKKRHLKCGLKMAAIFLGLNVITEPIPSNGSWCIGIKGEMSGTVCVTFTWDIYIYIYELFIAFFLFCCLFIIVTWWYMWCIVWQMASKRKYRHVW